MVALKTMGYVQTAMKIVFYALGRLKPSVKQMPALELLTFSPIHSLALNHVPMAQLHPTRFAHRLLTRWFISLINSPRAGQQGQHRQLPTTPVSMTVTSQKSSHGATNYEGFTSMANIHC